MTALGGGLLGLAVICYVGNALLIQRFLDRRAPGLLERDAAGPKPRKGEQYLWEQTAGTGLVPKWVSVIGLLGISASIGWHRLGSYWSRRVMIRPVSRRGCLTNKCRQTAGPLRGPAAADL